jgi:hypothetical protein
MRSDVCPASRGSMRRYLRPVIQSSCHFFSSAVAKRRQLCGFGKMRTTSDREAVQPQSL